MNYFIPSSLTLALLVSVASPTHAESSVSNITLKPSRPPSEAMAYGLAVGGTLIATLGGAWLISMDQNPLGGILFLSGITVGPSLGQFYAGSVGQGILGTVGRTLGGIIAIVGLAEGLDDLCCDENNDGDNGEGLMLAGSLIFLAGNVYSLVDTHFAINRSLDFHKNQIGLSPTFRFKGDRPPLIGAQAWARF